ncbi:MAG: response regulator [Anaerolineaceae bacterium]|nr:response regulator [Anaerolineaceae bacterium]
MSEKILIVDDDLETLRLVGLMLQRQGYDIVAANNGSQALNQVSKEKPDLIILDVMMPDIDGYQVTKQIRSNPETQYIPILMFTAKTQVDDKVAGYEAGVDDFVSKPIHPAELGAHVKALIARNKSRASTSSKGYIMGVIAPKGGLGVSSVVLNLCISLYDRYKIESVAVEMHSGRGCWAAELGQEKQAGLQNILAIPPSEIKEESIEKQLYYSTYGVRLLMASNQIADLKYLKAEQQLETILQHLPSLAKFSVIDFGAGYLPNLAKLLTYCNELLIITEPYPASVEMVTRMMKEYAQYGFGKSKPINILSVNRVRADMQISVTQMQEVFGQSVLEVIPPAPEIAYQSAVRNTPMIKVQPESLVAHQISRVADVIAKHIAA